MRLPNTWKAKMPNQTEENETKQQGEPSNSDSLPTEPLSGQEPKVAYSPDYQELAQKYVADQINAYYGSPMTPQPPQYAGYQQPVTAQNYQSQGTPELWYTDPAAAEANLKQQMAQAVQQYVNQQAQPLIQNSVEVAKHLSMNDPKLKNAWGKYGKEIDALVNSPQIAPQFKASKALWDQAANLILSKHMDEIVSERAAEMAATMQNQAAESGNQTASLGMKSEEKDAMERIRNSDYGKHLIDKYGERGVLNNLDKAGWSLDQYATMVENTHVTRHPDKPGEWSSKLAVKG
jgi:DNA-binding FrmR family transcriptional regulator